MLSQIKRYSSVCPKNIQYKNDGTSRDTYISYNGGGYIEKKNNLPLTLHEKNQRIQFGQNQQKFHLNQQRMIHYVNNGDGRDCYISYNSGGNQQTYELQKDSELSFRQSLRSYDRIPQYREGYQDFFQRGQSILSKKEWQLNKKKNISQKNLIQRLYK